MNPEAGLRVISNATTAGGIDVMGADANEIIVGLETVGVDAGHVCLFNDRTVGLIVDVVGATRPD